MLYVLQTCVTFFVGMKVGRTISNDFSYIGAPFLMGTVALGRCHSLILLHSLIQYSTNTLHFSYIRAPFLMGTVAVGRCHSLILQDKCYTV